MFVSVLDGVGQGGGEDRVNAVRFCMFTEWAKYFLAHFVFREKKST